MEKKKNIDWKVKKQIILGIGIVATLIAAGAIAVTMTLNMVTTELNRYMLPDIRASVSRGDPEKEKLGEFILTVYGRWGKDVVVFHDTLIDQELNFVNLDGTLEWILDPNFSDPETWKERYHESRYEYITGRKPKSAPSPQ